LIVVAENGFSAAFVCLHNISKTTAATITKLDVEMFHNESWKPIYLGVEKVKATKSGAGMGFCTLVSAGFF